jgi:hypothetical protein
MSASSKPRSADMDGIFGTYMLTTVQRARTKMMFHGLKAATPTL